MSVGRAEVVKYYNGMLPKMAEYHKGKNGRLKRVNNALGEIVKPGMKVLDVGCGTGITSKCMADNGGIVTAIDQADALIEYAIDNSFHKNITYLTQDVYHFLSDQRFDLIVFCDVLEHIVPENVFGVIHRLTRHNTHEETKIYVNIPDCNFLKFMYKNHPESLQIIDHGHTMGSLLNLFSYCGFEPIFMNIYGIDVPVQYNEYLFLHIEGLKKLYRRIKC